VSDYREAAQLAESYFCTPEYEAKHVDGVINQVVIFATDAKDMIERPTVEPTYSTIQGQKKSFAYKPIRPGVVGSRCASHWCHACMHAHGPGDGMTAGLRVDGCTGPERRWTEHHVERTDAAGVANERKRAQALGHKLARKLKVGDWIAVQARERWSTKEVVHYRAGHHWVGRVVDAGAKHFLGDGVLKQVTKRREDIDGTMFTEGDIAIAVEWYDRTTDDDEGLSFCKEIGSDGAAVRGIINSTELRAASSTPFDNGLQFTMAAEVEQAIVPAFRPAQVTPAVTRTGRTAAVVALAAAPPPPDDTVYVMPARVDHEIRRGCWLGGRYM